MSSLWGTTLHTLWHLPCPASQLYQWDEEWLLIKNSQSRVSNTDDLSDANTPTNPDGANYHDLEKGDDANNLPNHSRRDDTFESKSYLVDWIPHNDHEDPQNWSLCKKLFALFQIYIYNFTIYMGGAIFSSSENGIQHEFGVNHTVSGLGFALYLIGYGVGLLLFSPLSEIPTIGRNPPYMISLIIFVILCVPTALTKSYAGLLVLRFLLGFFGSPCLATGGATLGDMFPLTKLPFAMLFWAIAMTTGPAAAPVIGGFSVVGKGWRWTSWEILWAAGPVCILMVLFLPETSGATILHHRAKRIRAHTGDERYYSHGRRIRRKRQFAKFPSKRSSLCYAIFYSFFESFPHVYGEMYGFASGPQGLPFLSITVGTLVAAVGYMSYNYFIVERRIHAGISPSPEDRLFLALFSTPLMPIGLFIFAWTSRADIHWIVSCIGVAINTCGLITMYQCVFMYLPLAYPQYAASLFAGNDFVRSAMAGGAVLFGRPLFANLGVGKGVSHPRGSRGWTYPGYLYPVLVW
ncbi:unnamed protein product [Penicillium olsonii]|uniref:Major facilitator superfamily (MFS) profile domain-containing protein n=1 Tax=Penicillium olsonii TaxID=99116 RepID=A0A9W4HRK7_PENOL|nr:unnamed protein product [Penicillium olsonii]CAG8277376.1 unnamed protein product [Penicillium olsonii]